MDPSTGGRCSGIIGRESDLVDNNRGSRLNGGMWTLLASLVAHMLSGIVKTLGAVICRPLHAANVA
jgi:hypothetical protein